MVSSMTLHTAQCEALIRDACRIDPAAAADHRRRPQVIYEPWSVFSDDPKTRRGPTWP